MVFFLNENVSFYNRIRCPLHNVTQHVVTCYNARIHQLNNMRLGGHFFLNINFNSKFQPCKPILTKRYILRFHGFCRHHILDLMAKIWKPFPWGMHKKSKLKSGSFGIRKIKVIVRLACYRFFHVRPHNVLYLQTVFVWT